MYLKSYQIYCIYYNIFKIGLYIVYYKFNMTFILGMSHDSWAKIYKELTVKAEVENDRLLLRLTPTEVALQEGSLWPMAVYSTPLHNTRLCGTACSTTWNRTVHCRAVQCSAVQCSAVQCSAVQCSAVQCSAVKYSTVWCSSVNCTKTALGLWEARLIWTAVPGGQQGSNTHYCTVLNCTSFYCNELHFTALFICT